MSNEILMKFEHENLAYLYFYRDFFLEFDA